MNLVHAVYPTCCRYLESIPQLPEDQLFNLDKFLAARPELLRSQPFLVDLARIEAAQFTIAENPVPFPAGLVQREINPTLRLIDVAWKGLPELILGGDSTPNREEGFVIIWQKPGKQNVQLTDASNHDLLALKLVSEQVDSRVAAAEGNVTLGAIDDILFLAEQKGLLITPPSRIQRPAEFHHGEITDPRFFTTPTFTLQWHITQTCDLRCRHCYDRSEMPEPGLDECIMVLDQLYDFSKDHNVFTQVTFTGGNPLMYPYFNELYREAAERGFMTAILGNPMPRNRIEEILAIQKPEFYQVSLEGLRDHNDYIRGKGHFNRVFQFLDLLRELDIYSMVMLTLTRANMDQVLDLAKILQDRVDLFTYNRLAMVGEGAELASVPPNEYRAFLESYLDASRTNSCMGLKDNLMNIILRERKQPCFGGCAGRGCGAAFNFVALLPNGEVHACRKLPSPIGNINTEGLSDIYHGLLAKKYRAGAEECGACAIRPVCGGCLAVAYGFGLDIFTHKDPYCCMKTESLQTGHE